MKISTEIIRKKSKQVEEEFRISRNLDEKSEILEEKNDILHACMRHNLSLPINERQNDEELAGQIVTL